MLSNHFVEFLYVYLKRKFGKNQQNEIKIWHIFTMLKIIIISCVRGNYFCTSFTLKWLSRKKYFYIFIMFPNYSSNLYLYKYENVCVCVCVFFRVFRPFRNRLGNPLIQSFICFRKCSKTITFKKKLFFYISLRFLCKFEEWL